MSERERGRSKELEALPKGPPAPRRERERLFVPLVLLAIVATMVLFDRVPIAAELKFAEGTVTRAQWLVSSRSKFVLELDTHMKRFQPKPPNELPLPIADMVKPGMKARVGYTDETMGYFGLNNNLRVFDLTVDGKQVYTLDEYRRSVASDRPGIACFLAGSVIGALLCFPRKAKRRAIPDSPPVPQAPPRVP